MRQISILITSLLLLSPFCSLAQSQSDFSISFLDFTKVNQIFPEYEPIPEEVIHRMAAFHINSYWLISENFPYGYNQKKYVVSENIKSVTLREYNIDEEENPIISRYISDIAIFFDSLGNVISQKKYSHGGTLLSKAIFEYSPNKNSIEFNDRLQSISKVPNSDNINLSFGNISITSDSLGRIMEYCRSGGNVIRFSYKYDNNGVVNEYTDYYAENSPSRFKEEKYKIRWENNFPISCKRIKCESNYWNWNINCTSPYGSKPFIFSRIENGINQVKHERNTANGNIYRTWTCNYRLDSLNRLKVVEHSHENWNDILRFNYKNHKLISITKERKGRLPIGMHEIFQYESIDNKLVLCYHLPHGLFVTSQLTIAPNVPLYGQYELRFRKNGELSKIIYKKRGQVTALKIIDVEYYD